VPPAAGPSATASSTGGAISWTSSPRRTPTASSTATWGRDLYAVGALLRRLSRGGRGPRLAPDDPLARLLARATAFDPAARFASAAQMAEELAAL
jgi:hypothetical protein